MTEKAILLLYICTSRGFPSSLITSVLLVSLTHKRKSETFWIFVSLYSILLYRLSSDACICFPKYRGLRQLSLKEAQTATIILPGCEQYVLQGWHVTTMRCKGTQKTSITETFGTI